MIHFPSFGTGPLSDRSFPQRVFALHCIDRLDCVCATDCLHSCFREAEVLDFALPDQVLHRSRHVFDGHVRIDAVLIEQVDGIDPESLERALATCLMCSGRLSRPTQPGAPSGRSLNPNLVAITNCSRTGARASPTSSSFVNGPYASAVSAADVGVS